MSVKEWYVREYNGMADIVSINTIFAQRFFARKTILMFSPLPRQIKDGIIDEY